MYFIVECLLCSCVFTLLFGTRDPVRGWDRSRVKGLVASLVTVKERETAAALEVVAGGRLYNVVVDTEVISVCLMNS